MKTIKLLLCCGILVLGIASSAMPQATSARHGIGPQAGLSINPDQFVVGGQAIFGPAGSPIHLVPSADVAFGDHVTTISLNFDVTYDFGLRNSTLVPFVGAGPTIAIFSPDRGDNQTEVGLTLVGGVKIPVGVSNSLNFSARIGIGDIPDAKFMAVYIFRVRGI